jgi:hypothetical protein
MELRDWVREKGILFQVVSVSSTSDSRSKRDVKENHVDLERKGISCRGHSKAIRQSCTSMYTCCKASVSGVK